MLFRRKKVLSFDQERTKYPVLYRRALGVHPVEVDRIVGSVGRSHDIDADFRFKGIFSKERSHNISRAMERGEPFAAIKVYELNGKYYVLDGHHRVGAAKKLGQEFLDADITQFIPSGSSHRTQAGNPA
ncbi:MAG: ParB/Srx family N-terminal domain-containing protein [Limnochordia bacterium]|jgi:uncharacterized ParB-like nuclease family protein|nr:ParB/Srx family N-terminal domain-containing protein [Limnochordia bacterium]MDD2630667.1 ParB/Srx family N-terminal domain-containing protein [Limnochordia bacterium]MDD4517789.1 ParB/Srx family N-terminal domain-containing protein [Limnochordia bacterium]